MFCTTLLPLPASTQDGADPLHRGSFPLQPTALPYLKSCPSSLKRSPSMPAVCFGDVSLIHSSLQMSIPKILCIPFTIRDAPGKRLCRKGGHSFCLWRKMGWEKRSMFCAIKIRDTNMEDAWYLYVSTARLSKAFGQFTTKINQRREFQSPRLNCKFICGSQMYKACV